MLETSRLTFAGTVRHNQGGNTGKNLGHAAPIFLHIFYHTILVHTLIYLGNIFLVVFVRAPQILHVNLSGSENHGGSKGKKNRRWKGCFVPRVAYATAEYLPG